jgi:hypothetical protein
VQSINKEELEALLVQLPPQNMQQRLVEKVEARRGEITSLEAEVHAKAQQTKADVEAMILDDG